MPQPVPASIEIPEAVSAAPVSAKNKHQKVADANTAAMKRVDDMIFVRRGVILWLFRHEIAATISVSLA